MAESQRLPSGTVTFLLTDIEGSTSAWERDAAATAVAVTRHYELLDEVIAAHRGHRPVEQGEGDSTVSAFTTATDAVAAALAAQFALSAAGISVRMAVHTGEIELRDEANYFGPTIIRCARLRSTAHGGQVVLSDVTRSLVHDHLPSGASLLDLGPLRLKDLDSPERVWQLCHPDLASEFPRLRSIDSYEHNLPTRLTSLIGREADTAAVTTALHGSRLVTLVGTGGVGKTRLGLQVAAESVHRFDGGVWWVELATVGDAASVPGAILGAIGIPAQPGQRPVQLLRERVGDRSMMFVLDNCEHVIGAVASFVDELLTRLPGVNVLATSREPLSVPGETVWRVPSLTVPDAATAHTVASVERSEATLLFLERARRARSDFVLTDDEAGAVARICQRLDGIPLSIELAAARCRSLTVEQIARELDDRFRLLTGGARTVMERQQTLKASIDWSHELLGTAERAALRRMGVFVGSFTTRAAEAVIGSFGDIAAVEVLDLVEQLVDKSLLSVERADAAGESRFRLLETIRYYALDRLADAGELVAGRGAQVEYWAGWADAHNVHLDCGLFTSDAIPENLPNLLAATRWACSARPDLVQALILCIGPFVQLEGDDGDEHSTEGLFESALAAVESDEVAWAHVAAAAAFAYLYVGIFRPGFGGPATTPLFAASEPLVRQSAEIAERHDLPLVRAMASMVESSRQTVAPEGWTTGAALFEAAGSPSWASLSLAMGVRYLAATGRIVEAEEATRAPLTTGDAVRMWSLGGELQVAVVRGRLAGVAERAERELADLESPRSSTLFTTSGLTYEALSRAAFFSGDHDMLIWAANLLERVASTRITRRYAASARSFLCVAEAAIRGDPPGGSIPPDLVALNQASVTGGGLLQREFAYLAPATGDLAWIATERANIQRFANGDERARCFVSMCDALLALRGGDDRAAEHHWQEMLAIASEHGFGLMWIDALEGLAICAARAGEHEVAARLAGAAEAAREDRGYRYRYPHVGELPEASDDGRALSLEDATAWIRRTRGERVRPVSGWSSLTPTEVEVARAVGAGLSNQQVADRLFVSVATVKTHLRHVFGKLSIDNRAQLVAVVAVHDR